MTPNADTSAAARRDRSVERYILALDRGDFDAVAAVLAEAESDPALGQLLAEVDAALHAEAGLTPRAEDATTVRRLLRRRLPSAFAEPETGPPTVGDVAARLQAEHAAGQQLLLAGDRTTNDQLLGNRTALTGRLNARRIQQLADQLGVAASRHYWERFRQAAIALAMARDAGAVHLAAARPRPARPSRRPPPGQAQP